MLVLSCRKLRSMCDDTSKVSESLKLMENFIEYSTYETFQVVKKRKNDDLWLDLIIYSHYQSINEHYPQNQIGLKYY